MSSAKLLIPAVLLASVAMLGPVALAVGLGPVNVQSRLNQPLRAEIPLLSLPPGDADQVQVQLGSADDFQRIGLDRPAVLTQLNFQVDTSGAQPVIRVSSDQPIRDPFLTFLVRLVWSQGQLLREYTVLLDPPVLAPASAPAPAREPSRTLEREATQERPAERTRPEQPAAAQPAAPREQGAPGGARPGAEAGGGRYGPVHSGETLWSIATRTRPDNSISVNQMMLALLRTNPDAFYRDNINALKRGAVLRVPGADELRRMNASEAVQAVQRQNDLWQQYRRELARSAPTVVAGGEEPRKAAPEEGTSQEGSHLELVPPRKEGERAGAESAVAGPAENGEAGQGASAEDLEQELARTREELLAQQQQNEQNTGRVDDLEQQVQRLQRLLELKNSELAALQQQSGGETAGEAEQDQEASAAQPPESGAESGQPAGEEDNPFASDGQQQEARAGETTPAQGEESGKQASPPPPPPKSGGWMELLLSPMVLGILGLLLVGIGIALFLHKRRSGGGEYAETTLQRQGVGETGREEPPEEPASGSPEELGPPEAGPADYDEAALRSALEDDPADTETRLKLMRHYAATEQREAFIAQAETLYAQLADPGSDAWREAQRMGEELAPDHPLFGGEQDIRSSAEALEASTAEAPDEAAFGADFGTPGGEEATPGEEPWEPGATETFATRPEPRSDDGEGLPDFEFEPAGPEEAAGVDEPVTGDDSGEEDVGLDFPEAPPAGPDEQQTGLDLGDLIEPREPGEETSGEGELEIGDLEIGGEEGTESWVQESGTEGDEGAAGETEGGAPASGEQGDAVTTKIELAEAYADMGDADGARDLLQEVLSEGNEEQRERARKLLENLG